MLHTFIEISGDRFLEVSCSVAALVSPSAADVPETDTAAGVIVDIKADGGDDGSLDISIQSL